MRLALDAAQRGYEAAFVSDDELLPAPGEVDVDVEVRQADWSPRTPAAAPVGQVCFVDGVQRPDARLWGTDADRTRQALAVSYAAGVVRCDGAAIVEGCQVRRGLFGPSTFSSLGGLGDGPYRYEHRPTAADDAESLNKGVRERRDQLEIEVAQAVPPADLLVIDGPLRGRAQIPRAVGYVKSHHAAYLPDHLEPTVAALAPGQRTPLFLTQSTWSRWSWYLRLPHGRGHPWSGVVRCDAAADLPLADVVALADAVSATLPRFASEPHKDPRSPQNLYPIAGLERHLHRLLGDPTHLHRALSTAIAAPRP